MAHLVLIGGSGSNTVCAGQPISLAVRANQPHGTVTWASDRLFSQVLVIPPPDSLLVLQATNDTMFYIMTSSTNCGMTRVDSLRITIVDPRIHTSGDTLLCLGESINLYVFNDNQSVNLAYTWLPQEEVVGNPAAQSIRTKPRHDVLFKISARSPEGCIVFDSIKVSVDSARVDTLLFDDVMCHGDSVGRVSIAGHGIAPILYKWNDGSAEPVRDRLLPGRYSVTASDSAGCTSVAHFMISNPSPLAPDATLGYGACKRACNGTIALHVKGGTAPYTYRWDSFDTTSSVQDLCDGTYTVSIIDKNKCRAHRAFTMKSFDKHPALDASANKKTIYRSQAVVLSATPVPSDSVRYSWIPDYTLKTPHSSHTISTPDSTTTFFVTATDQFGCISVDTVSVTVKDFVCDTPFVFVPNVFTPNGDKLNDVVKVQGDVVINLYFAIYDRWGEKIFDTHDQSVGWDGSYRNKPLSPAVFVYYLEATCINNETIRRKGNITLVR
jgi:gliding motility-associated-like protein